MDDQKTIRQKYLGKAGLVIFLAAISAFPALSTDIYLPALPDMTTYFGVPEYQTNLTLILFFIFYAAALLLWGPFSDRYGRRPVLLIGMSAYALAGLACALSQSIYQLMAFRVLQAIGAAAASTVATAIVKDTYQGRRREITLAVVQSMTVFAPLTAPIVGSHHEIGNRAHRANDQVDGKGADLGE
jgi:DHA1 family bicyclomycin/chloramphenicol resistance-like MFS transporter